MPARRSHTLQFALPLLLMGILSAGSVFCRPLLPVDETRYISVAWEMHQSGDYLVSHINGLTYAHKPPLLFWLINAVWCLTGPSDIAARLVGPFSAAVSLLLTFQLARRLYPESPNLPPTAGLIQCSMILWMIFSPSTMFDALLTVCVQTSLLGAIDLSQGIYRRGVLLTGLGIGLGILSKGPVVFVHVLPVLMLPRIWSPTAARNRIRWFFPVGTAVLFGLLVAGLWAIPSAIAGGDEYGKELLWGQTAGRMVRSFAHRKPWWWYLAVSVPCTLPWIIFPGMWSTLRKAGHSPAGRFCLIWIAGALIIMSCVSGKQLHYLIPAVPGVALLFAAAIAEAPPISRQQLIPVALGTVLCALVPLALNQLPAFRISAEVSPFNGWCFFPMAGCGLILLQQQCSPAMAVVRRIAVCSVLFAILLIAGLNSGFWLQYDLTRTATALSELNDANTPVAWVGQYQGELNFLSRLKNSLTIINSPDELNAWLNETTGERCLILRNLLHTPSITDVAPEQIFAGCSDVRLPEDLNAICEITHIASVHPTRDGSQLFAISVVGVQPASSTEKQPAF